MKKVLQMQLVWIALAVAATAPSHAQSTDFKDVLSGKSIPLTLKLKDLNDSWRKIAVAGQSDLPQARAYAALLGGGSSGTFYTKGETVKVDGETFVIAYRVPQKPIDYSMLIRGGMGATTPPAPPALTSDTVLALSLLNLRSMGSLNDIRPFNLEQEISETPGGSKTSSTGEGGGKSPSVVSINNLKQVGLALVMYVQDHKETLPPMNDAAALKKALANYIKDEATFAHPESKEPYQPNSNLSNKKWEEISKRAEVVALYEASAASDGARGVLYLDGHVERLADAKWVQLKQAQKIP